LSPRPEFHEKRLDALFSFWEARKKGGAAPARADFDPVEMRAWLGNLMLVDWAQGKWIYRLYGTAFVEAFRREMTGKSIDELPAEQAALLRAEYEKVRIDAAPVWRTYSAQFEHATPDGRQQWQLGQTWERLALPLVDGGNDVSLVLVGAYRIAGQPI
jgi:hypothetical protein